METIYNYINGELIPPRKGNYLQVFAPSTGQPYAKVLILALKTLTKHLNRQIRPLIIGQSLPQMNGEIT